ncbi:hypothetical protein OSTOST_20568, partial [Ostertagia ostertagi]
MGKTEAGDEPVSFTDTNADTAAGGSKATGSAMMDLISGLQKEKGSTTGGSSTDRMTNSTQNYLLRIEGTLCCASIIIAIIWLVSLFVVFLICGIWSGFDFSATSDSVKDKK